ncbi:hypothetical protein, partial [Mesorhizobium sp. GbtcB19]|uniref:hypothetical protein n=1 Tax=Mesorhizobium sp. GbtcB19 TaxID=2824764 RepID=UPI001C3070A0
MKSYQAAGEGYAELLADMDEAAAAPDTRKLPVLSAQDARLVKQVHEAAAGPEEAWLHQLERYRSLTLPFARPASGEVRWQAGPWRKIEVLAGLDPAARVQHLLALWALYLARITGETEIRLGWGAEEPRSPLLAEMAAPVVPLEVEIDLDRTFAKVKLDVIEACERAAAAGSYAWDLLMRAPHLRRVEELRRPRPWDIAVNVIGDRAGRSSAEFDSQALGAVVTLQVRAQDGAMRWIHDPARIASGQVDRMTAHLETLAWEALNPGSRESPVRRLNLLPAEERELIVDTWNRTEADYPSDCCIHGLFEDQARRTPDAIALVQGDVELSYGELNARA